MRARQNGKMIGNSRSDLTGQNFELNIDGYRILLMDCLSFDIGPQKKKKMRENEQYDCGS